MEKLRFGIQVMLLMLALPACFVVQMKHIDRANRKEKTMQEITVEANRLSDAGRISDEQGVGNSSQIPVLKLVNNN